MDIEKITMNDLFKLFNSSELKDCIIEITNCCPFKCDHCYVDNSEKSMMSFNTFKSIVDQLLVLNCNSILITGGEPTINKDFEKMYIYAKSKGLFVNINSNGFDFNETTKKIFKKYKPDLIEISLYGYDDLSYEQFTHTKNSFNKVKNTLEFLNKNNINLNLKTTVTKINCNNLTQIKHFSRSYSNNFRYDYIIFPSLKKEKLFKMNPFSLKPREIIDLIKKDDEDVKYFKNQVLKTLEEKDNDHFINKPFVCSMGKDKIFIDSYGNIKPCLVVDKKYNLNSYTIKQALNKINRFKNKIIFKPNSKCQSCYKRKICRYCPGRFYLETSNYLIPPKFYCELSDLLIKEFK